MKDMKMNPVIHFEMPAADKKRVVNFYTSVFGWQMQVTGPDMGEYVLATTIESDKDGRPQKPGGINGGFFTKTDEHPVPSVVIGVKNIKEHIEKIKAAGGTMMDEPSEIPGVGWFVSFKDTEGNVVSLLQPNR